MNIIVDKNSLITALDVIGGVAKDNNVRPIIGNTKIECGDSIKLTGTNLQETIVVEVIGEIIERGNVVLDHNEAINYIKQLDDEKIEISTKENMLNVSNAKFTCMDYNEYPNIDISTEETVEVMTDLFRESIKKVMFSSAQHSSNLAINGVRVDKDNIVATDGYRLALSKLETGLTCTIPLDAVKNIYKILNKLKKEKIEIGHSSGKFYIKADNVFFITRTLELAFPDYKKIFSSSFESITNELSIEKKKFLKALKKVATFAGKRLEAKNCATFTIEGSSIAIKTSNNKSKVIENVDFEGENCEMVTSLNVKYIVDYLSTTTNDIINIKFRDSKSAFIIDDEYLIMPVAMND